MTYASEDLTDDTVFEEFSSMVDVDNLLQYFAIETYIANWDWPQNNIKMYTLSGIKILEKETCSDIDINTSHLAKGFYVLVVDDKYSYKLSKVAE